MEVTVLETPGLGSTTYLIGHDGVGLVVDPQRDIGRVTAAVTDLGIEPRFVLETHLHNDYVSGGRHVASALGAELVLPAGAGAAFPYVPAFHLEMLDAGPMSIRPLHTPGHTPEHVSYLVLVDGEPRVVFSGGSLLVGSAGRCDLLGLERAQSLVRLQFGSIHRLADLPGSVMLCPTHGAGSFCTSSAAGSTTSSIGEERTSNHALTLPDPEAFAADQLDGLPAYPSYFSHMGPINLSGPAPMPAGTIPELTPAQVASASAEGVEIIDTRPKKSFAAGHIPASWGIELGPDLATWAGWLLPFDAPIVLVMDKGEPLAEVRTRLARIGFDDIQGVLWGLTGWIDEGRPVTAHRTTTALRFVADDDGNRQVLDVRAPDEWEGGTVPGSVLCHLPDLVAAVPPELDSSEPVYVGCTSGLRASIAAGVLADAGYEPVVLVGASIPGVIARSAQRQGRPGDR